MLAEAATNAGVAAGAAAGVLAVFKGAELLVGKFRTNGKADIAHCERCQQGERIATLEAKTEGISEQLKEGFARIERRIDQLKK